MTLRWCTRCRRVADFVDPDDYGWRTLHERYRCGVRLSSEEWCQGTMTPFHDQAAARAALLVGGHAALRVGMGFL